MKKKTPSNAFKIPLSLKPFIDSFSAESDDEAKRLFQDAIENLDPTRADATDLVVAFHLMRRIKPKNEFEKGIYAQVIVDHLQKNMLH